MFDKDMLKSILAAYGPSGREQTVSDVIRSYVEPFADEVYNDTLGNLIAVKKGTSGKKVMLSAHMDQIGLIVVDIGATTREEAEAKVQIGDVAVYVTNFVEMGSRVSSGALDDRIACAAVVEAFRTMQNVHDVYAVFTVQEEVGLRGAGAAAYAIEPDLNISLDVTGTGDTPKCGRMSVKLGAGATVKVMDSSVIVPPVVRAFLVEAADEKNIRWQPEVLRAGGTDTGAVQRTRGGILSGCISIPTRYIHSPVETADMGDYEAAVQLVCAAVAKQELPHR